MKKSKVLGVVLLWVIVLFFLVCLGSGSKEASVQSSDSSNVVSSKTNSTGYYDPSVKTYHLADSQFQIPKSYDPIGNEGSNFASFTSSDLAICNIVIWEMADKSEYNSVKDEVSQSTYPVEKSTQQVGGVSVEKYIVKDWEDGPKSYIYFFVKNGKYYRININIENGSALTRKNYMEDHSSTVYSLINTIVSSMA